MSHRRKGEFLQVFFAVARRRRMDRFDSGIFTNASNQFGQDREPKLVKFRFFAFRPKFEATTRRRKVEFFQVFCPYPDSGPRSCKLGGIKIPHPKFEPRCWFRYQLIQLQHPIPDSHKQLRFVTFARDHLSTKLFKVANFQSFTNLCDKKPSLTGLIVFEPDPGVSWYSFSSNPSW